MFLSSPRPACGERVGVRGVATHRVESTGERAIWSEVLAAGRPSWFGRNMTTSLHPGGPLVMLDDVHLTLGSAAGPVNILRGISLEIGAGETVSIVGPSGSGKSTLMMVLGGLERPSSGRVRIDGVDLSGLDEDALARLRRARIGIVFQSFHLLPTMTALENVAIPLELGGRADAFATAAASPRDGRPRSSPDPLSRPAVGRRAAARGDRPRLYRRTEAAARRRADRKSRRQYRPPRHRLPVRATRPARHDFAVGHS